MNENTDKFLLALGAFAGFGITFFASLSAGDDVSTALLKSAVGMIACAVLVKILISVAHSALRDAAMEKRAARKSIQEKDRHAEAAEPQSSANVSPAGSHHSTATASPPESIRAKPAEASNPSASPVAAPSAPAATGRIRPARSARRIAS